MKLTEEQLCHIESIYTDGNHLTMQAAKIMTYLGLRNTSTAGWRVEEIAKTACKSGYWKTSRIIRAIAPV